MVQYKKYTVQASELAMNESFRYTLVPVILGSNLQSRVCAVQWRYRFRVRTHIMSDRYHPALLLSISCQFHRLYGNSGYTDFVLSDLIRFAQEHSDKLLVLIATTPHYQALIREHHSLLESYYILSDPALSFLSEKS